MKAGYFSSEIDLSLPIRAKMEAVGWNAGNIVFIDAIRRIFDCDRVSIDEDFENLSRYGVFITNDLIWLREGDRPWAELRSQLSLAGDRPLIPLSVGLQTDRFRSDFKIHPEMVRFLKALAERVPLPTRGAYTAETLERHGIFNVKIMGCPSLYQLPFYPGALAHLADTRPVEQVRAVANMCSIEESPSKSELDFLLYIERLFSGFADQTLDLDWKLDGRNSDLKRWLVDNSRTFFDMPSWIEYCGSYNFSMGARFHGNVVPLLAGVKSLFIAVDSRTEEMTDFFNLPKIHFSEFDSSKDLQYYRDFSDYSLFLSGYKNRIVSLSDYSQKSGLPLSNEYRAAVSILN